MKSDNKITAHLHRQTVLFGATVLIGLIEKSHKHKGFEQSIDSINLIYKMPLFVISTLI